MCQSLSAEIRDIIYPQSINYQLENPPVMVMLDLSLITPDFTSGTVTSATMLCVILFFPLLYACTNSFISAVISGLWFDNLCKYLQLLLHDGYGVTGVTVASKDGLKYSSG